MHIVKSLIIKFALSIEYEQVIYKCGSWNRYLGDQTEATIAALVTRSTHDSSSGQRARDRSFTSTDRKYSESSSEVGTRSSPGVYRGVDQPDFSHAPATLLLQTQASTLQQQQQQPPLVEAVRQTHNPPGSYGRPFAATPDAAAGGLRTARERPPSGSSSHRTSGASAASNQIGRAPGVGAVSYGIAGPVRVAPFVGQINNLDGSGSPAHVPYGAAVYPQATLKMAVTQNSSEPITRSKLAWDRRPVDDQRAAMRRSQSDDSLNPANSALDSHSGSSSNSGAAAYPAPQTASGFLQPHAPPRQYPMGPPQAPPPPRPAVRTSRSHQQPFSLVLLAQRPSAPTMAGAGGGGGGGCGLPHSASSPQRFDSTLAPASSSVVLRSAAVRPAAAGAHVPVHGSRSGSAASTPTSQAPRYSMHLPDADSLSWNSLVRAALAQPPPPPPPRIPIYSSSSYSCVRV